MKKLIFLMLPLIMAGQEVPIGSWKDYLSYSSASYITLSPKEVFCVSSKGLFKLNKKDQLITRMSKVTGLSDVEIKLIEHDIALNISVIVYENCNIDLIKEGQIINISDIKRKEIIGLKEINSVTVNEGHAYISSSFGIVVIDLINEEIKDTYNIINNESLIINDCAITNDNTIYAATSQGIYIGNNNTILNDPSNWVLSGPNINTTQIIKNEFFGCALYLENQESFLDVFYPSSISQPTFLDVGLKKIESHGDKLLKIYNDSLVISSNGINSLFTITEGINKLMHAVGDNENDVWIADSLNGLIKLEDYLVKEIYVPEGPARNNIFSLNIANNSLFLCHGGHENYGVNSLINSGVSIKDIYDVWNNIDRWDLGNARDILNVAVRNNDQYYASWYHGIPHIKNNTLVEKYGYTNTGGILDTTYYSNNRIRISDLKFDNYGNLWGLSSEVSRPLFVKTINNEWFSFSMNQSVVNLFFDDLLIDSWNQKWGLIGRGGGLFVYNNNNTIDDSSDDEYKILSTSIGNGNLPSQDVYSICMDKDDFIWIGTSKGIGVFYYPNSVFSPYNFDAQQILIQENDYGQYLLSQEKVTSINVDGANRKWVGTEKAGVFLLSEDGTEEIHHFTSENSPLYSNNIVDIAINNENGEVFIGTSKGLISYRSTATEGRKNARETTVFPNPVRETYNGPIAIKGLTTNARIKITDVAGNLVYEDIALGGQAIWDGKNKYNERAATGVYLVFSVDESGKEKMVSKIMFIR